MKSRLWLKLACSLLITVNALSAAGQKFPGPAGSNQNTFGPLEQWKDAVLAGNTAALSALYSTNPPARVKTAAEDISADADVAFWRGLKARRLKVDVVQSNTPQTGLQQIVFQAEIRTVAPGSRTLYVSAAQIWQQQGDQWRLVFVQRTDPTKLQQPVSTTKDIYGSSIDAHTEIKQALSEAAKDHKRVLVIFGANWCYDCHVLDLAFERPDISAVLKRNYEVVHVDVGQGEKNQDLMNEYDVPMKRGIPAAAVLDSNGKLLVSQRNAEFEKARSLGPEDVLQFLNKWKPQAR
jgi:hypothetical protein